jgi:hypothetical protein
MSHVSIDIGENTMPTPWSLNNQQTPQSLNKGSDIQIKMPKLNGNVDQRGGSR